MKTFPLKIVTADGIQYDGEAEELVVRTTTGDIGIMAGHINCVAPLGMGRAMVVINGKKRYGACIGGMVSVIGGCVRLVPATFEWAEHIDMERAERSFTNAKATLADKNASDAQLRLAEARLRRALVRKGVGSAQ